MKKKLTDTEKLAIERQKFPGLLGEGEDKVNHPKHYNSHPSGIEAIRICRHMPANIAAAMKYLWRTEHKNGVEDLKKAIWYIADQIDLIQDQSDQLKGYGEQIKQAMKVLK